MMHPRKKKDAGHQRPARTRPDDERSEKRDAVEEASEESFPASDSPSWSPLHPGAPGEHPDKR